MPKAFVINRCIFCGNLPCICGKPATKHPTKSQHTTPKRRAAAAEKKEPSTEATPPPSPPVSTKPVKRAVPRAKPISSLQAPVTGQSMEGYRAPGVIIDEAASFGDVKALSQNDEMERAIQVLRDAGLLHPLDPHSTPEQRAALWRAQAWRRRHGTI